MRGQTKRAKKMIKLVDDFQLDEHMVVVEIAGGKYYAMENGTYTNDEDEAFKHFHWQAAKRLKDKHVEVPGMTVSIKLTNGGCSL